MHRVPHAPQFVGRERSSSQPLAGSPSQSAKGAAQTRSQRPAAQVARAFAAEGHAVPHAPQWTTEVAVSVSQPLRSSLSQLPRDGSQTTRQTWPSTQRVKGLVTRQS
jgi:hypothetical protein